MALAEHITLPRYALVSVLFTAAAVWHAATLKRQFYPAAVYLSRHNASVLVRVRGRHHRARFRRHSPPRYRGRSYATWPSSASCC